MANIKKRIKKRLPLVIIFLVLLVGVGIFTYPIISNWICQYTARTEIASYDAAVKDLDTSQIEALEKKAEDYNKALAKGDSNAISVTDYSDLLAVTDAIGYVDIPKIGVYLPIYHDISDDVLQKGVGHMEGTSLPVGGESTHSVLAGHTGLPTAELFTDLDQLKNGDVFYIHVLGKVLAYKVDQIKIVLPENDDDIQIISGEDYVTLLTCTPYGINDHRLLVRGTRIPYDENAEPPVENQPSPEQTEQIIPLRRIVWYVTAAGTALITVIILLILFLPFGKKRKDKKQT